MLVPRVALALLLALIVATPVAGQDADAPTPLLQAMAYLQPGSDPMSVSFVDWAQLKRLYGAEEVTSASPLEERQRLLLEVAREEAVPLPLGLDRLAIWSDVWGWDTTDLEWQARYLDGRNVLRFHDGWDPAPFRSALETLGFERDSGGPIEVWRPPADRMPSDLRLEQVGYEMDAPEMTFSSAPVTIGHDGRTVVIHSHGGGTPTKQLRKAARPKLARIAGTPAARAAAALGDVVVANVAASPELRCRWPGDDEPLAGYPEVSAIVDGLHRYVARADGYRRSVADAPATVRYVFSHRRPRQARADLEGRSALVEVGHPRGPLEELTLLAAQVEGRELILDVQPKHGHPGPYVSWHVAWAPFSMCGAQRPD